MTLNDEPITRLLTEELRTVEVTLEHRACGGYFHPTGESRGEPKEYEHRCSICNVTCWRDCTYPRIEHERPLWDPT